MRTKIGYFAATVACGNSAWLSSILGWHTATIIWTIAATGYAFNLLLEFFN